AGAEPVERVRDEGADGLGRIALPLEVRVDRIADLDQVRLVRVQRYAYVADQAAAVPLEDGELHPSAGFPRQAAGHVLDLPAHRRRVGLAPPLIAPDHRVAAVPGDLAGVLGDRTA